MRRECTNWYNHIIQCLRTRNSSLRTSLFFFSLRLLCWSCPLRYHFSRSYESTLFTLVCSFSQPFRFFWSLYESIIFLARCLSSWFAVITSLPISHRIPESNHCPHFRICDEMVLQSDQRNTEYQTGQCLRLDRAREYIFRYEYIFKSLLQK